MEGNQVLKIDISSDTLDYEVKANGLTSYPKLNRTVLFFGNEMHDLIAFQDNEIGLPKSVYEIERYINQKLVTLPYRINKNICDYLQSPRKWGKFDCHGFSTLVASTLIDLMDVVVYDEEGLYIPGSQSYITNKYGKKVHTQIYLGEGLFLSKGGNKGPVMVSSAQEMLSIWGGTNTYIEAMKNF